MNNLKRGLTFGGGGHCALNLWLSTDDIVRKIAYYARIAHRFGCCHSFE